LSINIKFTIIHQNIRSFWFRVLCVTPNKSSCLDQICYNQVNDYYSGTIDLGTSDQQCIFSNIIMSAFTDRTNITVGNI